MFHRNLRRISELNFLPLVYLGSAIFVHPYSFPYDIPSCKQQLSICLANLSIPSYRYLITLGTAPALRLTHRKNSADNGLSTVLGTSMSMGLQQICCAVSVVRLDVRYVITSVSVLWFYNCVQSLNIRCCSLNNCWMVFWKRLSLSIYFWNKSGVANGVLLSSPSICLHFAAPNKRKRNVKPFK